MIFAWPYKTGLFWVRIELNSNLAGLNQTWFQRKDHLFGKVIYERKIKITGEGSCSDDTELMDFIKDRKLKPQNVDADLFMKTDGAQGKARRIQKSC